MPSPLPLTLAYPVGHVNDPGSLFYYILTSNKFDSHPYNDECADVMIHMKEGGLSVSLSQNEK